MTKRVKITQIEKKYKNKRGEEKTLTINFAKVADRIAEFRKDNPRGLIETTPTMVNDILMFKTRILRDKSDANSAESTGHAMAKMDNSEKQFEKLETISVGRALALLGYGASGEVASFEEMEEFNSFRDNQIDEAIMRMNECKTIPELRECFMSLGSYMSESRIIEAKNKRKAELDENSRS